MKDVKVQFVIDDDKAQDVVALLKQFTGVRRIKTSGALEPGEVRCSECKTTIPASVFYNLIDGKGVCTTCSNLVCRFTMISDGRLEGVRPRDLELKESK